MTKSRFCIPLVLAFAITALAEAQREARYDGPIIDMHLHAYPAMSETSVPICSADHIWLPRDPQNPYTIENFANCDAPLQSATTDEELMQRSLELMERFNVIGVASGEIERVQAWEAAAPSRIIPALESGGEVPTESIRNLAEEGDIRVLGELTFQYNSLSPSDSVPDSYFALAEELDLPVALHMGLGPPGAAYFYNEKYRMRLSDPLLLEESLLRYPKMRIYVMHAGWPMSDHMVGLLLAHPQVYVDVALINWMIPRKEFHSYLKRLIDAGFEKRVMFGSDHAFWPEAMRVAIESIQSAEFLNTGQKADIFYNNAARFLRLSEEEIATHNGN